VYRFSAGLNISVVTSNEQIPFDMTLHLEANGIIIAETVVAFGTNAISAPENALIMVETVRSLVAGVTVYVTLTNPDTNSETTLLPYESSWFNGYRLG
jgi:hypothetical protein